jgi:hypothetical protein
VAPEVVWVDSRTDRGREDEAGPGPLGAGGQAFGRLGGPWRRTASATRAGRARLRRLLAVFSSVGPAAHRFVVHAVTGAPTLSSLVDVKRSCRPGLRQKRPPQQRG